MEFGWSEAELAFRDELRAFIRDNLPEGWISRVPGEEPYSETTVEFCRRLGAKGWLAPHWPRDYGGGGDTSPWRFTILSEELWAHGEPRGSQYMNTNWIGPAIIAAGTDDQKQRFLPPIAAGEALWCQGFSEPGAGSDLGAMATTAVRDGDHYVINGEKIWTSYAGGSHHCFLLARTGSPNAEGEGVTIFLLPMSTPGVSVEPIPSMLDIHVIHHLRFDNARVSVADRLGPEGGGWPVVREALVNERVGAPRHMRAARVLDEVVQAAAAAGRLDAAGLRAAGEARAVCLAARGLVHKVRQMGAKGDPGALAYVARAAVVQAERAVAEVAADLAGPGDLVSGALTDGEFRTALIAGLGGGSYEMQLNLTARLWLKLPKAA